MMIKGFAELTLEAQQPEELAAFYVDHFGLTELSRDRDRVWLSAGSDARLGLWTPGRKEFGDQGGNHVHFAFHVEPGALTELAERLVAAGMKVDGPVEHEGEIGRASCRERV